jgi:exopolysaccharide biosynthesis polyprenyl glycosylphosphotransferase
VDLLSYDGTTVGVPTPRHSAVNAAPTSVAPPQRVPAPVRRTPPRWMRRYLWAVLLLDLLATEVAVGVAHLVRFGDRPSSFAFVGLLLFPPLWLLAVHLNGGYAVHDLGTGTGEFRSVLRAGVLVMAMVALISYALFLQLSRGFVLVAIPLAVLLTALARHIARRRVHRLRARGRCMRSVIAVGRERSVLDLVEQLRRDRYCGMEVVAACVPDPARASLLTAVGVPVLGNLEEAAAVVRGTNADAVAVTSASETAALYLRRLSWELEGSGVELLVAPGLMEVAGPRLHMRPFVGLPLLAVEEPNFRGTSRVVKTLIDRFAAGLALLVLAPVLLGVAVAVRLDSAGPSLYRQERIGKGGRPFTMFKFRSMVIGAHEQRDLVAADNLNGDGLLFKARNDTRVTRVGRVLRRFSLDELPQLINVLTGSMSLVGPRPPLADEVARYEQSVHRRLLVTPGLTGLWQVSGRSDLTWEESVRLDLRYVENWSLTLDLMILWKTLSTVVRASGAY